MVNWKLKQTNIFEREFKKIIPKNLQEEVKKLIFKLTQNPYNSKPLGCKFFREKKIKKWRIYFLIYKKLLIIYFIEISDKKLQQKTINRIKSKFKLFKDKIEK